MKVTQKYTDVLLLIFNKLPVLLRTLALFKVAPQSASEPIISSALQGYSTKGTTEGMLRD